MSVYTVNKAFTCSAERTARVMEIAESFGLGLSDREFVIYDNLDIEVQDGDVVYINGQSGSGKSLLLRELVEQMRAEGKKVADLNDLALEEKPVIDLVGESTGDAAKILAQAGISDAWIYIRKPSELSDGQRYRVRLAQVIDSDADVWVADEFGAVLDRVTARVVANNIAKVARREGKTLIVATTHEDLVEELAPNLKITKRFREKVDIEENSQ